MYMNLTAAALVPASLYFDSACMWMRRSLDSAIATIACLMLFGIGLGSACFDTFNLYEKISLVLIATGLIGACVMIAVSWLADYRAGEWLKISKVDMTKQQLMRYVLSHEYA